MKSIQIRETPLEIYNAVASVARKEHRSMSQQALTFLALGVNATLSRKEYRSKAIENYIPIKPASVKFNAVLAIREDRQR